MSSLKSLYKNEVNYVQNWREWKKLLWQECFTTGHLPFSSVSLMVVANSKLDLIIYLCSNKIITCFILLIETPHLRGNLDWKCISKLDKLNDFFGLIYISFWHRSYQMIQVDKRFFTSLKRYIRTNIPKSRSWYIFC